MLSKEYIKKHLLVTTLIFLILYAIVGTMDFLEIEVIKAKQTTQEEKVVVEKEKKNAELVGIKSTELMQQYNIMGQNYSRGNVIFINNYIYKVEFSNNIYTITKTNIENSVKEIVVSGYKARNLMVIKNNIYCIIETMNNEKIPCDAIAKIEIETGLVDIFESTITPQISSMISDGSDIYYTKKDNTIFRINLEGTIYSELLKIQGDLNKTILFGLKDGFLYYVNGVQMGRVYLTDNTDEVISTQICSPLQSPFIEGDIVYGFSTVSKKDIIAINIKENNFSVETIMENKDIKDFTKSTLNAATNLSYYKGFLFFNINEKVYGYNLKTHKIEYLKNVNTYSNIIVFCNNSILTESNEYGELVISPITWLLASE